MLVVPDQSIGASIQFALTNDMETVAKAFTKPICPGSECSWDTFHSFAICSDCADVSGQIKTTHECGGEMQYVHFAFRSHSNRRGDDECYTRASLPNGQFLESNFAGLSLSAADGSNRTESLAFARDPFYLWSATILRNDT